MKAGNPHTNELQLTGTVILDTFAKGSKSEHKAVYLQTDTAKYVLRRKGGNPFYDSDLQKLIGKKITATGTIDDYLFIASGIRIEDH